MPACGLSAPGARPPHVPLPPPAVLATARATARAQDAARAASASEAAVCALDWQPLLLLDLGQRGDTHRHQQQQQQQQDGQQAGWVPAGEDLQHFQPHLPHAPGSHHHQWQQEHAPHPRHGGRAGGGGAGAWEGHSSPGAAAGGSVTTRWFVLHWWPHEDGEGDEGPAASQSCGRLESLGAFCARFAPRPARRLRAGQEAGGSEGGAGGECEGGGGEGAGGWAAAAEAAAREALEAVTGLMVIAVGRRGGEGAVGRGVRAVEGGTVQAY